jgi:thioesterase domain-containing protein
LPVLYSVRGWTEEVNPAYTTFVDEMRATGVEVIDIFPDHEGCATFGEWAQRATDEILQRHSQGQPLHLFGFCAGGAILQESVRQLAEHDVRPEYLGFIDYYDANPKDLLRTGMESLFRVGFMKRIRGQMLRLTPPNRESIGTVGSAVVHRSVRSVLELRERGWRSRKRIVLATQTQFELGLNWDYDSIASPAFLYNCQKSIDRSWPGDPSMGRAAVLQAGFVVRIIEGHHETGLMPPHSAALIEAIDKDRRAVAAGTGPFQ